MGQKATPVTIPPEGQPPVFKDRYGREWDVALTMLAAARVDNSDFSELTDKKFSILEPDREVWLEIFTHTPLTVAVVWAIVQPQVLDVTQIDPKHSPEEAEAAFLDGLDGPALSRLREAVWRSVADFFPEEKTVLLQLMNQYNLAHKRLGVKLAGMETEFQEAIAAGMDQQLEQLRKDLEANTPKPGLGGKSTE